MTKFIVIVVIVALAGCRSSNRRGEVEADSGSATRQFELGMRALEDQRYKDALSLFEGVLRQHPGSEFEMVVLFNSAAALEGLGDCREANERYRRVVKTSNGQFKIVESQALFRMSMTYECLDQDTKVVTSLLDTIRRAENLPVEVVKAEIPARMSAAYARLGNPKKAQEYFNMASKGLKEVLSNRTYRPELLGQTLYLMGQLSRSQRNGAMNPVAYYHSIHFQQPFLLHALETGNPVWSKRAAEDLILAYENATRFKLNDEIRSEFYTQTMKNLHTLRRLKLVVGSDLMDDVFAKLEKTESFLRKQLVKASEGTKLTEEAEKREGLKRSGRVVGPESELEESKKKTSR